MGSLTLRVEPTVVEVTSTWKVQELIAVSDAPDNNKVFGSLGSKSQNPEQVAENVPGTMLMPGGNSSVKTMPVKVVALGLLIVKVKVEVWPMPMTAGEKLLLTVGGKTPGVGGGGGWGWQARPWKVTPSI